MPLVLEGEDVLTDHDLIAVLKGNFAHAAVVHVRAVETVVVFQHVVILFKIDLRVVAGDREVVDLDEIVR